MASILVHLAVGKKLNEKLCKKEEPFLTGCIAPDLAKLVGLDRNEAHFKNEDDVYEVDKFLDKYKDYMNNDYVFGYYIHLYTDYLWYKYFAPNFYNNEYLIKKDGTRIKYNSENMLKLYMYSDFSNINLDLIKTYDLDLEFFYKNEYYSNSIIEEIPYEKMNILIETTVDILNKKNYEKSFMIEFDDVKQFIDVIVDYIISNLKENKLI